MKQAMSVTQPLREEHRELLPHIEALRAAADAIDGVPGQSVRGAVDDAYDFLAYHLIPHAEAEDRALYPVVQRLLGAPEATATMSRDHVEVGRLTRELDALRSQVSESSMTRAQAKDLRRVLYGLYTLVKVHFAKEEEIYLPLLDARLSDEEAHRMFVAMEAAAAAAKGAA